MSRARSGIGSTATTLKVHREASGQAAPQGRAGDHGQRDASEPFSLVTPLTSGLVLAFWGLVIGVVIGGLAGLLAHAIAGGRRDFSSIGSLRAGRYDVVATADVAERARQLLSELQVSKAV